MSHLTADELIDAMEGMLEAGRQAHLETCDECRRQLADLSTVLREARAVDLPEPSPLFWQHFSQRVRTAIDAEPRLADGWTRAGAPGAAAALGWKWLRWPVLAAGLVVTALVVRASIAVDPIYPAPVATEAAIGSSVDDAALSDERWVLVSDIVGDMDWDTASAVGLVVEPGAVERAVLELSAEEQRELTRLLRAELRAKS